MKTQRIFLSRIAQLAAVLVLSMSGGTQASTLLMDAGPTYGTGLEGVGGPYHVVVVQPFTLHVDVEDFEALALLYPGASSGVTAAEVLLTTQAGPGATAADVIATRTVPGSPFGPAVWTNIMSVPLLAAGDYYFVMKPEIFTGDSSYWWQSAANHPGNENGDFDNAGRAASIGGNTNLAFPPASNFSYYSGFTGQTRIYGNVIPEPSPLALTGMVALGALAFARRRRRPWARSNRTAHHLGIRS